MPSQLLSTLPVLLPKPTKGFRTVGLFPALYRVLIRQQAPALQAWEARHPHPSFSFQGGQNALHRVWCQAAEAEAAAAGKGRTRMFSGAFMQDMTDYYERIHRQKLGARHQAMDFPAAVGCLSMQQY